MNLDAITIVARPGEQESLALALRAAALAAGVDLDYDELCAALGLSFTAVATPAEISPAFWPNLGRDVFVEETARLFGLQLRNLHPPGVGVDMLWAEEFPQHFELSYKPLIRRALENGQPVLAWRGWEADAYPLWGVITAADGEFVGTTPLENGRRIRLDRPALQCYVIEQCNPRTPPPEELAKAAALHADAYLNRPETLFHRGLPGVPEIVTGPAAYDLWARWFEAQVPTTEDCPAREAHRLYASALVAARFSGIRCLERCEALRGPQHAAVLDSISAACEVLMSDLGPSTRTDELRAFWSTAEGHEELLEAIRSAQAADRQIADYIRQLAAEA